MITIEFEDHGQDFLQWDVAKSGQIVACRPFQAWAWVGKRVTNKTFKRGACVSLENSVTIKYAIKRVTRSPGLA